MAPPDCILVVDDEPAIRRALRNLLRDLASRVVESASGAEAIELAATERPDLIVLDLGLPDVTGAYVCEQVRRFATTPIIVLSASHSVEDKVRLLNLGADDYVTKPFSAVELSARIRAVLRRADPRRHDAPEGLIVAGEVSIDLARPVLLRAGQQVRLTRIEWNILRVLVREAGRTVTHRQLYDAVWHKQHDEPQVHLRVHITNLRQKIEAHSASRRLIVTDPGVGYRFELPS